MHNIFSVVKEMKYVLYIKIFNIAQSWVTQLFQQEIQANMISQNVASIYTAQALQIMPGIFFTINKYQTEKIKSLYTFNKALTPKHCDK